MRYDNFTLQLDTSAAGGLKVRVLSSPAGEGASEGPLPSDVEVLRILLREGTEVRSGSRQLSPADDGLDHLSPQQLGGELFGHLLRDRVKTLFDQSLGGAFGPEKRGLRIQIKIDPTDPLLEQLSTLPWELLYRPEAEGYLALSQRTPIVRYLDVPRPHQPITRAKDLRVLVAMASPHDLTPLYLGEEKKRLLEIAARQSRLKLTFIEHAAGDQVRERLKSEGSHVLHFMGHGDFDVESREGLLYFEREDGGSDPISGQNLATSLKDLPHLGLVFLNACNTARLGDPNGGSPFSGVASALVLGGLPAVLAMQYPIGDRAAIRFSQAFYRHLAKGEAIEIALTEGRQAIHGANARSLEWAIPVLFSRVRDGVIFEPREARLGNRLLRLAFWALLASGTALSLAWPVLSDLGWFQPKVKVAAKPEDGGQVVTPDGGEKDPAKKPPEPVPDPPPSVFQISGLRFEVTGNRSQVNTLRETLQQNAPQTSRTAVVRLNLKSPSRQAVDLGGQTRTSCRLSGSGSITRDGITKNLGGATGAAVNVFPDEACAFAAQQLAENILHQLQPHL